jgi:hypothetical protein
LKPLINFPLGPRIALGNLRLNTHAVWDAYRSRLGRTLEPTVHHGQLDYRSHRRS